MKIAVKVEDEQVRRMLGQVRGRMGSLTPAMKIIGEIVKSSVIKNFQVGGRPPWPPTKAISHIIAFRMRGKRVLTTRGETSRGFARYAAGKKTLIDTGRLMKSISARAYANRAEVGTNVVYAAIHQLGGKAGRGRKVTIPARPYLMVQREDWREIRAAMTDYLMKET